jgi:PLD-like domain
MSQIASRFVKGDVSDASLRNFVRGLAAPGGQARQYLADDLLPKILNFLSEADRRGGTVYAALYEINDQQLIDALKPFGSRGHVLIGNGSATKSAKPPVSDQLSAAKLEVRHRDLSHSGKSSPSVHNKFVVEADAKGQNASRVLTGSTNWTTTGLCTQLNNMLIVEDTAIAARFRKQWDMLVQAGDNMTPALKTSNSQPTTDNNITLYFAATNGEAEFKPVLDLIAGAKEGALFLMFMPGQSSQVIALKGRKDLRVSSHLASMTIAFELPRWKCAAQAEGQALARNACAGVRTPQRTQGQTARREPTFVIAITAYGEFRVNGPWSIGTSRPGRFPPTSSPATTRGFFQAQCVGTKIWPTEARLRGLGNWSHTIAAHFRDLAKSCQPLVYPADGVFGVTGRRHVLLGNLFRNSNWLLRSRFCRSRCWCWLGYHNRIGNRLRNIDGFRAGLMTATHARPP